MTHAFRYHRAGDLRDALGRLQEEGAQILAGGTDLVPRVREGLTDARLLVDVSALPELSGIATTSTGTLRVGGATTLREIASSPLVRQAAPALAEAAIAVGTAQLRAAGTLGGNLAQATRCLYWRRGLAAGAAAPCGHENAANAEQHGIFPTVGCRVAHPSDPAVALTALGASVEIAGPTGATRTVGMAELLAGGGPSPVESASVEPASGESASVESSHGTGIALAAGELIVAITVPTSAAASTSPRLAPYTKVTARAAWDFALVSRALAGSRIVLGGVAAAPWIAPEDLAARAQGGESAGALAEQALVEARPSPGAEYKVRIAHALLREAYAALGASA